MNSHGLWEIGSWPAHLARRVEDVCRRFEAAWQAATSAEQRPRIEVHLSDMPEPERAVLLRELLDLELDYRRQAGEALTTGEYCSRFPDHVQIIREAFLEESSAGSPGRQERMSRETPPEERRHGTSGDPFRTSPHVEAGAESVEGATAARVPQIGGYKILGELGRGGMGVVYQAQQVGLNRLVALKMILAGGFAGEEERARFRAEAEAVARLQHPQIVQIHDIGEHEGLPFFSLEFCPGGSLSRQLDGTPWPPDKAARLLESLARASQAAHAAGIVHRDLKPGNVLLAADGTAKITDFGLAKRLGAIGMTATGSVMGTPEYMSPEQARGEARAVDARGDVYSLGVMFYELLSGQLPFRGNARMLLHQVVHDEPRPLRSLNDSIPRDLETIALKAMAKEPARRYQSARDLADDLRRWLQGEPIQARPVGRVERALRWVKRRPAAAALLGVSGFALLALVGLIVGLFFYALLAVAYRAESVARGDAETARRAEEEQRRNAENAQLGEAEQRKKAEDALALADRLGYVHSIFLASVALKDNNVVLAQQRLAECKPDLRDWEWYYLKAQCHSELFSVSGITATFSPDGTRLAVSGPDGVRGYDARTGVKGLALQVQGSAPLFSPVFSPDGARLAAAQEGGVIRVYHARTGAETFVLKGLAARRNHFFPVVFSPDGARLAAVGADGMVRVYDARTGVEALALKGLVSSETLFSPLGFSPDGARLAVAGQDGVVRIYHARTGAEAFALQGPTPLFSPVFSADGTRLAAGSQRMVRVYDARTGAEALTLKVPESLASPPLFSPDGARLATAGQDGAVRVYDAHTGAEALTLKGLMTRTTLFSPVFSPDGTQLAVSAYIGRYGVVRVYDARTGAEALALKGPAPVGSLVFSPDGARLAAVGRDGLVRVYDARASAEARTLLAPAPLLFQVFSPDRSRLAVWGSDRVVRLYDARTGAEALAVKELVRVRFLVFSPDGTRLALVREDGVVRVVDARTGAETLALELKGPVPARSPVFSPDGSLLAAVGQDGVVRVVDARTGVEVLALKGAARDYLLAFSPDGTRLAVSPALDGDGVVRVYDTRTGVEALVLKGPAPLFSPVFSPDGARLAVSPALDGDGVVRVVDARTGVEVLALKGPATPYTPVFSPDGAHLATVGQDGAVRVYDAQTGVEALALKGLAPLGRPVFSSDGRRLAAVGEDGIVRVYDARSGAEVLALQGPALLINPVLSFSPDGARLAAAGRDGVVRVYDAPRDMKAWQVDRRQALENCALTWYQVRAAESEQAGQSFAAAFYWGRLTQAEPANGQYHFRRGLALADLARTEEAKKEFRMALALKKDLEILDQADAFALLGRWPEAARMIEKAVPTAQLDAVFNARWSRYAVLGLQQGDYEGYRKACAMLVQRISKGNGAVFANAVAWRCALGPDALRDLKPAVELARTAVRASPTDAHIRNTLGAILYRAGQFQEAVTELNEAIKLSDEGEAWADCLFLALAHHQLGQGVEARRWLDQAVQGIEREPAVAREGRLERQLLRREAEVLINGPTPNYKE